MKNSSTALRNLSIIMISALVIQLTGHYFAGSTLVFGDGFYGTWVILRIIVPAIIVILIGIPFSQLFFKLPQWDKVSARVFLAGLGMLVIIFLFLQFFGDDYLSHYQRSMAVIDPWARFQRFLIFTSSTMTGWEILHRCFLLGGLIYCFKQLKLDENNAAVIAVLITCVFEAMFHIKKPMYESYGMILASPFFCWLTVRTQSVWPAMVLHFLIEVAFAYNLYFS